LWAALGVVSLLALYLAFSYLPFFVQYREGLLRSQMDVPALPADMVSEPLPPVNIQVLAVSPGDPDVVYAGTYGAGIYVSRDGGQSWAFSGRGLAKGTVCNVVIDPDDTNVVYAAFCEQGGVSKSTDGGQTWFPASRGIDLDQAWDPAGLLYLDPTTAQDGSHGLYYSGTENGLYHSSDGAATWEHRHSQGPPAITDLIVDPNDGEHLYAGAYGTADAFVAGVYESQDGGRFWRRLTTEEMVAPNDWWQVAAAPRDWSVLYASGEHGAFKTTDGGLSWTPILDHGCAWLAASDAAIYCGAGEALLLSVDQGLSWREASVLGTPGWRDPVALHAAIAPGDPLVLYHVTDEIMKSINGGRTWAVVGEPGGLGAIARMRLTVDPRDGSRLFLNGFDFVPSVHRSEDGARTWQIVADHGGWRNRLTVDPARDVIYLPRLSPAAGLYRSWDNGQTWEQFGSGDLTPSPSQLVPDPRDADKLWLVGECGAGLSLSEDGGKTFARVESFPGTVCQPILLVHGDGRHMYVAAWDSFYRSPDSGETWRALDGPGGIFQAAALDPSNADVVFLGSTHKGVFKTEDGGLGWRAINAGLTSRAINDLAIDPANPQTLYAATDGGAFVSQDGGERWHPLDPGPWAALDPNPIVYSVGVVPGAVPGEPSKVYAVSPGGVYCLSRGQVLSGGQILSGEQMPSSGQITSDG
jgi:photosystem II stability/assembly factor-like uncharacterized protein